MIVLIYGFLGLLTENKSMNSYEFSCGRFIKDDHALNYLGKQIGLHKQVVTLTTLPDKTQNLLQYSNILGPCQERGQGVANY